MEDAILGPTIRRISKKEASTIISAYHYLGNKPFRCSYAWGLRDDELVGAVVFHGVSAPETVVGAFGLSRTDQRGFWEIGRLVLAPQYNGGNWGTHLLWGGIRELKRVEKVRAVITYADSSLHTGGIYKAGNFTYCGLTAHKKDFYVGGRIKERGVTRGVAGGEWRDRPRKHRFVFIFDKTLRLQWPIVDWVVFKRTV